MQRRRERSRTQGCRLVLRLDFAPWRWEGTYDGVDEAIETANDTPYGLAAYLQTRDFGAAKRGASKLRAGQVMINHPAWDASAPFGGFKQSGNGRECGESGFEASWSKRSADFLKTDG
jgi:acyl-CoA reductase-like NAD-dependent aldehyde dehydrogenase